MSAAGQPRYGLTLPRLAGPAWRRLSWGQRAVLVLAALVLVAIAALSFRAVSLRSFDYSGPAAPHFSLSYSPSLKRASPREGELIRLEQHEGKTLKRRLVARTYEPEPRRGQMSARLPFDAIPVHERARREIPGYRQLVEGRARLGADEDVEAYHLIYEAPYPGDPDRRVLGKIILIPERGEHPSRGVVLELAETTRDAREEASSVGTKGLFKKVVDSFELP